MGISNQEKTAFTAVVYQILNQSIVSVNEFYKDKVAFCFMEYIPEQREFVGIISFFNGGGKGHLVI